jgi:hypothetical protein
MKKEKNRKNLVIITSIIIYALLYFFLIVKYIPNYSLIISGLFTVCLMFVSYLFYGFQTYSMNEIRKKVLVRVAIGVFLYFSTIYLLGFLTGYLKNAYSLNILSILKNIFIPFVSIVSLEIFRYIFVNSNKESIKKVSLCTIFIILLDIIINYHFMGGNLLKIFVYLTVVIIPIIIKNIVLSYLSYQVGWESCLVYVLPTSLFIYFVPLIPDIGNYLTCILGIIVPIFIFISASRCINEYLSGKESKHKRLRLILLDIPLLIIVFMFVALISKYFNYQLIGVDTSAISPTVDRGDAALVYKKLKLEDLKEGDIIAYQSGKDIIIDRVYSTKDGAVQIKTEIEKGSNEENVKTRNLSEEEFIGKYKFRVRYVAYPTIWVKDYLEGDPNEVR